MSKNFPVIRSRDGNIFTKKIYSFAKVCHEFDLKQSAGRTKKDEEPEQGGNQPWWWQWIYANNTPGKERAH